MQRGSSKALDVEKTVEGYLSEADWRLRENSNMDLSFSSIFFRLGGGAMARYTLLKVYPEEISKAHVSGDFHIHNLYMGIIGYCAGWAVQDILMEGFSGVPAKTESRPPKHLSTALLQIANFAGTLQNEWPEPKPITQ